MIALEMPDLRLDRTASSPAFELLGMGVATGFDSRPLAYANVRLTQLNATFAGGLSELENRGV